MTHLTGKNESRPLFLTHCRYVDKSFIEMLLEQSSTEYTHLVQNAEFNWLLWQPKG